jgi:hypothetical protein
VSVRVIGDGLTVTAYQPINPTRRVEAVLNRVGVYVFWNLPGLRAFENGSGNADFWQNLPPQQPFVIEVEDTKQRFQPFTLLVNLPIRNLFPWECVPEASPLASPVTLVPLYSSPNRSVPAGMAVIRAQLWDAEHNRPAAWAVLEARVTDGPGRLGVADKQGRATVIFPYPEPLLLDIFSPLGSPPGGSQRSLFGQTWPVQLKAFYQPDDPAPSIPNLCQALAQMPATLWRSLSPAMPLAEANLKFGQELILRSEAESFMYITPAGSPPA